MKIRNIAFALCLLIAIAVSIKSFREPDLWWQIRTGEWILQHHEVPKQDVFSYTMNGTEWINIKWGFEVAAAFVSDLLGPESVFILQAIVNCLLVVFLLKLSGVFFRAKQEENDFVNSNAFLFSGAMAFLVVIVASEYRMIGRPEMVSHLMTIIFLFLLEKNRQSKSKQIFLLIPLQLLWANLHEAFGTGLVLLLIYTASAWLQRLLSKEKKTDSVQLGLITVAAAASVCINPNGIKLLTRPFNILRQVYSNKYTTELLSINSAEWWKKEAYITLLIAVVSVVIILSRNRKKKKEPFQIRSLATKLNDPYLLSIIAFLYLGMTAYRNLIFLALVCFPALHYFLFKAAKKIFVKYGKAEKMSGAFTLVLLGIFYTGIVSGQYYKLTGSRDRFGLEVLSVNNPTGAADFILQHQLEKKKCFSDYLTSSYLMWKLQPDFKTYIDLRDLDIFPAAFFNDFIRDVNSPVYFHKLDSLEKFDYAVVFRPQFDALHAYLYNDSIYALKYADAVAAVYEKTDDFSKEDIFSACKPVNTGIFARTVNKLLNPFYTPFDYPKVENDYIAANYYLNTGRFDLARLRAEQMMQRSSGYKGKEILGQIYFRSSMQEGSDSGKNSLLNTAETYYLESLRENKNYSASLMGLGSVHLAQKNFAAALKDFLRCLDISSDNYQAHLSAAQCYRELISISTSRKAEYTGELLKHFLAANSLNPGNPMVLANIGFIYFQQSDCDHAIEFLSQVADEPQLSAQDQVAVKDCLRQCNY